MRTMIGASAGIALALLSTAQPAGGNEYAHVRAASLFNQLGDSAQCESALPNARTFWRSSDFSTLSVEIRAAFLNQVMSCAWSLRDYTGATSAAVAARELGATWPDYALMQLGIIQHDDALTLSSFDSVSPATVSHMPIRFVWSLLRAAQRQDPSGEQRLRIHRVLVESKYSDPEGVRDDALRLDHARVLIEHGRIEEAKERISPVVDPRQVLLLRVSRAFDPIRNDPTVASRLDLRASAEADLERAREAMAERPRELAMVLDVAQALRSLSRNEEALALLDLHLTAAQASSGEAHYDDIDEQLNWLLNEKGYTLYDLNRAEEARAAFGLAIAFGEHGAWNVSQVINFASMLEAEGRAADALEVVQTVGEASPYGDMWVASVRACAAVQIGRTELLEQALAFLRAHESDNVAAASRAFLCVNDLDAAAALFIRRLADPEQRDAALIALQIYNPPPSRALPRLPILMQRLEQVRERAAVRAAVEAVGHIERVPLTGVYWGDI